MNPHKSAVATASSILTVLAHSSAPFLSTFLLVHLSVPIAANIGGSGLASSVLLLGREYYQTPFRERYLLLLPFAVHVTSNIAKRIVLTLAPASPPLSNDASDSTTAEQRNEPKCPLPTRRIRKFTSLLSISAYTALLIFVPIHVITHRLLPAEAPVPLSLTGSPVNSDVDIDPVGPSELDFEFVKTALHTWPWRSWVLYAGVVGCVLVHAVEGVSVILAQQGGGRGRLSSGRKRRIGTMLAGTLTLTGLFTLSKEPILVLSSLVGRYQGTLMRSWVYRL
ncbi:hypothetical protein V8B97DRAFT_1564600 [Scleroderma yunnanense]